MCTDDLIVVVLHDTGTVKLRARWFSRPALTGEAIIGKPDTAKGTIINAFVFLCLTHTPSDWLNNELPCPARITLGPIVMPSVIEFVQSLLKRRSEKIMHQGCRVKEPGKNHGDMPTLKK